MPFMNEFHYITAGFDKKKAKNALTIFLNGVKVLLVIAASGFTWFGLWVFIGGDLIGNSGSFGSAVYTVIGFVVSVVMTVLTTIYIITLRNTGKERLETKMRKL